MARLPGLRKGLTKSEQLELELARQGSLERLERLLAHREAQARGEDDSTTGDESQDGSGDAVAVLTATADGARPTADGGDADERDEAAWVATMGEGSGDAPVRSLVAVMDAETVSQHRLRAGGRPAPLHVVDDDWETETLEGDAADASSVGGHADADATGDGEAAQALAGIDPTELDWSAGVEPEPVSVGSELGDDTGPAGDGGSVPRRTPARRTTPGRSSRGVAADGTPPVTPPAPPRTRAVAATPVPRPVRRRRKQPPVLAACPSCAVLLDPPPDATRRCTECRERIIVRRLEAGVLFLTTAAAAALEAAQRRATETARVTKARSRWLALATDVGATAPSIERIVFATPDDASIAAARTLYLRAAEKAVVGHRKERRFADAAAVRRTQAAALHREERSPEVPSAAVSGLLAEAALLELRGLRQAGRDAELAAGACCEACRENQGLRVKIVEELRTTRLPREGCTRGLCRCRWIAVPAAGRGSPARRRASA